MPTLIALALLLQSPTTETTERGVATEVSRGVCRVQLENGTHQTLDISHSPIGWHLDPSVTIPPWRLRVGMRMKVLRQVTRKDGEVAQVNFRPLLVCLGPLEKHAEDVERAIRDVGGRLDPELVGRENLATIEALGSASFLVRAATTDALRRQGIGALDVLLWAKASRDREVRTRAEMLLRPLGWEG